MSKGNGQPPKLAEKFVAIRCLQPEEITIRSQMRKVIDEGYIVELAESIKDVGQINEVLINEVDENGEVLLVLMAGEHRLMSIKYIFEHPEIWNNGTCPVQGVMAKIYHELNEFDRWVLMGAENLFKPPTTMEYVKQVEQSWKEAKRLKVHLLDPNGPKTLSVSYVASMLGQPIGKFRRAVQFLEKLDSRIRRMVRDGKFPYNLAVEIAHVPDRYEQLLIARDVKANNLRGQKAIDYIRWRKAELSRRKEDLSLFALTLQEVDDNLQTALGRHINQSVNDGLGYLEAIDYMVTHGILEQGKPFRRIDRGRAKKLEELAGRILEYSEDKPLDLREVTDEKPERKAV